MSRIKHTPGPWAAVKRDWDVEWRVTDNIRGLIATLEPRDGDTEANARLIAAAPELAESLRRVWAFVENGPDSDDFFELRAQVRAALGKAAGK